MPQELDELQRKIMQLQIEETALKQEEDKKAIERREDIREELAQLQSQRDELYTRWEDEKAQLEESKGAKVRLERARLDLEQAQNEARYEEAAKLQYGVIPQLEARSAWRQRSRRKMRSSRRRSMKRPSPRSCPDGPASK